LSVYGPNGFFRSFKGSVSALHNLQLDVHVAYDVANNGVTLTIGNSPTQAPADVTVVDRYTGQTTKLTIAPSASVTRVFPLARFYGWYDFVITLASDASIRYEVAGHLETGKASISDPALGGLVL